MRVRVVRGSNWFFRYSVQAQHSPTASWLHESLHWTYWGAVRAAMRLKAGPDVVAEV